mmetsp:Transcript_31033/g.93083  ORF Transcript_31033/g.93083 Transcript_31033/m.93083 type:complete len:210 (-) Transcript_31033:50-679(-)
MAHGEDDCKAALLVLPGRNSELTDGPPALYQTVPVRDASLGGLKGLRQFLVRSNLEPFGVVDDELEHFVDGRGAFLPAGIVPQGDQFSVPLRILDQLPSHPWIQPCDLRETAPQEFGRGIRVPLVDLHGRDGPLVLHHPVGFEFEEGRILHPERFDRGAAGTRRGVRSAHLSVLVRCMRGRGPVRSFLQRRLLCTLHPTACSWLAIPPS